MQTSPTNASATAVIAVTAESKNQKLALRRTNKSTRLSTTESLAAALADELPDERIAIAIRDALTATQTTRSGTLEPDHKTRLQAATLALAYKHGRAIERQQIITANATPDEHEADLSQRIAKSPALKAHLLRLIEGCPERFSP